MTNDRRTEVHLEHCVRLDASSFEGNELSASLTKYGRLSETMRGFVEDLKVREAYSSRRRLGVIQTIPHALVVYEYRFPR